jgi:hypothetical protein
MKRSNENEDSCDENAVLNSQQENLIVQSTLLNEENEFRRQGSRFSRKNSMRKSNKIGSLKNEYPLNPIDRKSSQIFYAKLQANALCSSDEKEDQSGEQKFQ